MAELKPCPFCGGTESTYIKAVGGEWVGLILGVYGAVMPRVCIDCGLVYVDKAACERIKKRRAEDGKL